MEPASNALFLLDLETRNQRFEEDAHLSQPCAIGAAVAFDPEERAAGVEEQRHVLRGSAQLHGHKVVPAKVKGKNLVR